MRAVQVAEKASSLNSDDVFVLETPSVTYIWNGTASSDDEKSLGVEISALVSPGRNTISIAEGEEPAEFWNALGGKGPYTTIQPDPVPVLKARLFHCILSSFGRLRVEEIKPFKQEVRIFFFSSSRPHRKGLQTIILHQNRILSMTT